MAFLQFHTIAAARGDGLRPELRALLDRLAVTHPEPVAREDGMTQSGPSDNAEPLRAGSVRPMLAVFVK